MLTLCPYLESKFVKLTPYQRSVLKHNFTQMNFPPQAIRNKVAKQLGLTKEVVNNRFVCENKRRPKGDDNKSIGEITGLKYVHKYLFPYWIVIMSPWLLESLMYLLESSMSMQREFVNCVARKRSYLPWRKKGNPSKGDWMERTKGIRWRYGGRFYSVGL